MKQLNLWVDEDLAKQLKFAAIHANTTMSAFASRAIRVAIEAQDAERVRKRAEKDAAYEKAKREELEAQIRWEEKHPEEARAMGIHVPRRRSKKRR